ncbi:PHP domain-containing protein [Gloeocapsopsis dulcis]|uniref:Phosphatase n=1 Tax=Gloeocapsopsis dulcis AAB1 = 1H9 TaxID=1433147 RepID=A0A6N8FU97_9CHRO|nr:PHP domain-containing protein [Gloeocapsopsis dulcis]MUL35885.1 phosphatase [Gloeocapsopsis dulcis AAB1 = 1H9]WNN87646.1 PHP domain-containing protein [Gloeocapsopsis dulcis]
MAVDFAQTSASSQSLKQIFHKINAQSCPRYFNFHMHTVHSDGKLQPEELVQQAIAIGLNGLAITDHHTVDGYRVARHYLDVLKLKPHLKHIVPEVWTGVEINANLLNIDVHILGYAFQPEHFSIAPYLQRKTTVGKIYQAENVIAAIHQAGGLAVLAHPARYKRSHQELIPAAVSLGIDGVEAFYAYNNPNPWRPSLKEATEVQILANRHGLFNTCGTDTHGLSLLQRL